ncbi:MAG TPA: riboflavin synthase [Methylomirabilota bacterium]|nr:riboflavin synthase [Methylomirabilota bacterium]
MFTGIVEELGEIRAVARKGDVLRLDVAARATLEGSGLGASLAVNGVCLTAVETRPDGLAFDVGPETLARTTLGTLKVGEAVNLERPLRFGAAVGGHLVLGHVDGIGTVIGVTRVESTARVRIALPGPALAPLLVEQGSVAVDGVSLTIAALERETFEVMVIPHTLAVTTFGRLTAGRVVNIETDVIGKYLQRSLALKGAS